MDRLSRILALLATLSLLGLAHAQPGCTPSTTRADVDTGATGLGEPRYYVSADSLCILVHCHLTFWVYEESNGIDGLQRQDEVKDDTCGGPERGGIEGDTVIF